MSLNLSNSTLPHTGEPVVVDINNLSEEGKEFGSTGKTAEELAAEAANGGKTAEELAAEEAAKSTEKTPEQIAAEAAAAETKTPEEIAAEEAAKNEGKTPEQIAAEEAAALLAKGTEKTAEQIAQEASAIEAQRLEARQAFLKEFGFESEADLIAARDIAKNIPETEEARLAREQKYNTDLVAFGISNNILSTEDIATIESLKGVSDRDIVFNDFKKQYYLDNKDRTTESADGQVPFPVTDGEVEEEFNNFYHTNSENKTLQGRGAKLIEDQAVLIKNGPNSKLGDAKVKFDNYQHKNVNMPAYQNFIDTTVTASISDTLEVKNGDEPFQFKLKDASGKPKYDVDEIKALFVDDRIYHEFLNGDKAVLAKYVSTKVNDYLLQKNFSEITAELKLVNVDAGKLLGSTTGAKAPFQQSQQQQNIVVGDGKELTPEQRQGLERMRRPGAMA